MKSQPPDQRSCCRAPAFVLDAVWSAVLLVGPPAVLPSPPFPQPTSTYFVSPLHASLCIAVVGVFVVVVGARGRLPYVEFSLIPVRTGADFSFTSVPFDLSLLVVVLWLLCLLLFQR